MSKATDKARLVSGMRAVLGIPNEVDNRVRDSLQAEVAAAERAARRAIQLVDAGVGNWSQSFDHTIGRHVINYHDGRREVIT